MAKREAASENRLTLTLVQEEDFRFRAELGTGVAIVMDEPPPGSPVDGPEPFPSPSRRYGTASAVV